ncbi:helix-turn-helix transcriptional regulator [Bifidobacterium leontopitheci]|uniref:Transcriptional regulator n=1 Tax=Bifidobacterium leontopitheci TaxID=2650774 RepID=A0A6I1GV11_9BIFI|nr:helix-turn-helix transcriptional regulator [Bifidobacterium leontopitheci]KAB7790291.1 transcriptional regulator [Bifidobacterium leontopitheci]
MAANEMEQWWIDRFQENLGAIRKVAGWTTQQLADELGVARQTVSNLETGRSPMTKLQYLALRTVFGAEIAKRDDRDLARIIKTLVDDPVERKIGEALPQSGATAGATVEQATDDNEVDAHAAADVAHDGVLSASQRTHERRTPPRNRLSTAMQALAVITAALASGTAAGVLTYLIFPDSGSAKRH